MTQADALCRRLILDFAWFNDQREFQRLGALFHEDGEFQRPLTPDITLSGRAAIVQAMQAKPPDQRSLHVCTNIVLLRDGAQRMTARTRFAVYGYPIAESTPDAHSLHLGWYHDLFTLRAGQWRIQHRRGHLQAALL